MKKLLLLFSLLFIGFFAKAQADLTGARTNWSDIRFIINENFDTIYTRVDSLDLIIVSDSVKAVIELTVRDTLIKDLIEEHGGGVTTFLGLDDTYNSYTAYELPVANGGASALETSTGMRYYGDSLVVDNNSIVHGNIGIGITDPLSALHINKGFGTGTGIGFSDNDTEIYENTDDNLNIKIGGLIYSGTSSYFGGASSGGGLLKRASSSSTIPGLTFVGNISVGLGSGGTNQLAIISNNKEIARAYSDGVTEQFRINPQGDLTGTAAAPSLAISAANMGFYALSAAALGLSTEGGLVAIWASSGIQSKDNIPLTPSAYDLGTTARIWQNLWTENINSNTDLPIKVNSIEAMRLTEDSVLMDSSAHIGKDLFVDGNVGIGTSTPNSGLEVKSTTSGAKLILDGSTASHQSDVEFRINEVQKWNLRTTGADDNLGIYDGTNYLFYIEKLTGDIGIRTETPSYNLDVNGTGRFTGIVNFDVFPITPSSAPTTDYQVANKKYVDDNTSSGTSYYAVNSSAFRASTPSLVDIDISLSTVVCNAAGTDLYSSVNLPHGAVVTSVIVRGDVSTRTWTLTRSTNGTATLTVMGTNVLNSADVTITPATIDNQNYSYGLDVSSMGLTEIVYDATIIYTL